jgi:hypothetical protein
MAYVPDEAIDRQHELNGGEVKLFNLYCRESNEKGECQITLLAAANRLHHSKPQVCINRKALAEKGWIEIDGDSVKIIIGENREQLRARLKQQRDRYQNGNAKSSKQTKDDHSQNDNAPQIINSCDSQNDNGEEKINTYDYQNGNDHYQIGNDHYQNGNADRYQNGNAYKEYPEINLLPEIPEREREETAHSPPVAVLDSAAQLEIFERYYAGQSKLLSIYQQELLGTMKNLDDCEAAIRYSAGQGIRPKSMAKIVDEVYKNREWERAESNGNNSRSGTTGARETASKRNANQYVSNRARLFGNGKR